MSTERPDFALESYGDEQLPQGERLSDVSDLIGHTVKAVVDYPRGRLGDDVDLVIVTDTLCWITLTTSDTYSCDERSSIEVRQCRSGQWSYSAKAPKPAETLHDYLSAQQMLHHGLVNNGQYQELQRIEEASKERERQDKAAALRKKLAELEGGAA